jgi:hypothetical protein
MARGWMLDEVAIRKIVADHVKLVLMYPTNSLVPEPKQYAERQPRRQRFLNSSGEECPAYAVMEVTAGVRGGASAYTEERLTITKPTSTFNRLYLVNGPQAVANNYDGEGTWLMDDAAGRPVLYASGDGTPAWGESWGAKASQWTLAKNRPGFLVTGANNTTATNPYTSAVQHYVNQLIGKSDADITKGSSGTISIWMGTPGSETDSTINVTAWAMGAAIEGTSPKWVSVVWTNGAWYVGCWET